jgi:hypothetical protein
VEPLTDVSSERNRSGSGYALISSIYRQRDLAQQAIALAEKGKGIYGMSLPPAASAGTNSIGLPKKVSWDSNCDHGSALAVLKHFDTSSPTEEREMRRAASGTKNGCVAHAIGTNCAA